MKKIIPSLSQSSLFRYNKEKYNETEILNGILNNNDPMIRYIYRSYFPGIKSMVGSFHNLSLDAEDVFQEGFTRAVINVREKKFNGASTFYTYLTSICRNVCLKELKRPTNFQEIENNPIEIEGSDTYSEDLINTMIAIKSKMDDACKQIIDLRFGLLKDAELKDRKADGFDNTRFEEIAKQLNIEVDNARQRFRRCLEKFKIVLSKDPLWRELTN